MIRAAAYALALLLAASTAGRAEDAVPGLPPGTDFGHDATERPRQVLAAEAKGGKQSYLVALGNTAFSAPSLFGPRARAAGLSCDTCHRQGDVNARFFIPGVSQRPGGLDPTTATFNPAQDDGVANHVDIPSLRGIRQFGPYGRDGRTASLREFTRNVIVLEFGGAEPAPHVLDALVAYMEQFELLENPKLDPLGRLTKAAGAAARRGEALFRKPMAGMGGLACAGCTISASAAASARRRC